MIFGEMKGNGIHLHCRFDCRFLECQVIGMQLYSISGKLNMNLVTRNTNLTPIKFIEGILRGQQSVALAGVLVLRT